MTIRYSNGYQIEGVLLTRTEDSMRVAVEGADDVLQLKQVNGTWISEECEPVQVDFCWTKQENEPVVTLDGCICSKELAAKLLHMLFSGDDEAEAEAASLRRASSAPVYHQVI